MTHKDAEIAKNLQHQEIVCKSWDDFRNAGMLWLVNRFLHIMGWSLIAEIKEEGEKKYVHSIRPVRTKFRGFDEEADKEGFKKISGYMANEGHQLWNEVKNG
jgi:hypothetical protein